MLKPLLLVAGSALFALLALQALYNLVAGIVNLGRAVEAVAALDEAKRQPAKAFGCFWIGLNGAAFVSFAAGSVLLWLNPKVGVLIGGWPIVFLLLMLVGSKLKGRNEG